MERCISNSMRIQIEFYTKNNIFCITNLQNVYQISNIHWENEKKCSNWKDFIQDYFTSSLLDDRELSDLWLYNIFIYMQLNFIKNENSLYSNYQGQAKHKIVIHLIKYFEICLHWHLTVENRLNCLNWIE